MSIGLQDEIEGDGIAQLETWCGDLGIDVPPVPQELSSALQKVSAHAFSTRSLPWSPYCFKDWVVAAGHGDIPDYLVVGHGGHGANSYALSYFLVLGNLRLSLQVGFGGVYMDAEQVRRDVRSVFKGAGALINAAASAPGEGAGLSPMLVAASEFYGSSWSTPQEGERELIQIAEGGVGGVHECLRSATTWFETFAENER